MSKLGGFTAFAAEAALWVSGAALIASAAGAHWSFDPSTVDLGKLLGSGPSPTASTSPTAAPLAPGASPTISPIVTKYLAFVAQPGFQIRTKYNEDSSFTVSGTAYQTNQNGTMSYKGGGSTDSHRQTVNGAVSTDDEIDIGSTKYESQNGAAWTKSARSATDVASDKLLLTPTMLFVDKGIETKNGLQLHRLDVADEDAFSKALVKATNGATGGQFTYTVWVADDGIPADFKFEGWMQESVSGFSTKATIVDEVRIIATSGVTISAPI